MKIRKLKYGGGINDLGHNSSRIIAGVVDGITTYKGCPYYQRWTGIFKRCFNPRDLARMPCYLGASICDEWLYFSNFKSWMEQQDWEGKVLDKDLLVDGNKVYSPDTCLFIPNSLNVFLTLRGNKRGEYPVGVNYKTTHGRYVSQIMLNGKKKHLGLFYDPALAHKAWQEAKLNQAKLLQFRQTCERTKLGLQRVIDKLTQHIEQGVETKSL